MGSFFLSLKIDEIMRAPYGGVFVEELIGHGSARAVKGMTGHGFRVVAIARGWPRV